MTYLPVALTIAGTDPSGGAGIMADLKSFQARDVYGMAVVTSLVAQNTRGVQLIEHVSPQILKAQLESVFSDIPPQAVKTGMLATTEIMEIIQPYLKKLDCPYVLDPVMVATSGDALIDSSARDYLKTNLLPLATIITPNLPEAEGTRAYRKRICQCLHHSILSAKKYPCTFLKNSCLIKNLNAIKEIAVPIKVAPKNRGV